MLISPQQVYDDPKQWLDVLHEVHDILLPVMEMMFPDFPEKLKGIHCLRCEGKEPFQVYLKDTWEPRLCTGYIEGPEPLLRLEEAKS